MEEKKEKSGTQHQEEVSKMEGLVHFYGPRAMSKKQGEDHDDGTRSGGGGSAGRRKQEVYFISICNGPGLYPTICGVYLVGSFHQLHEAEASIIPFHRLGS